MSNEEKISVSLSEKFKDLDDKLNQQRDEHEQIEIELNENYQTFLEKFRDRLKLTSWQFAIVAMIISFSIHLVALWIQINTMFSYLIFQDFSFFISIFIGIVTLIAFEAMGKLREFSVNLISIADNQQSTSTSKFHQLLKELFVGSKLVPYGIIFGAINVGFSFAFGIQYLHAGNPQYWLAASIILQYFLAGFICGICLGGIILVTKLIGQLDFKKEIQLDYFYPDRCAGTLMIGKVLFFFALYTIFIGLLIFIYIHNTSWLNEGDFFVKYLILFWKLFPFFMASIVFFYPLFSINKHLRNYKYFEQLRIRKRLGYLNELILRMDSENPENKEELERINQHYEKLERVDLFINEMNTWPYNLTYRTAFISVFLPSVIGIVAELTIQFFSDLLN